jgi:hypothetical protein
LVPIQSKSKVTLVFSEFDAAVSEASYYRDCVIGRLVVTNNQLKIRKCLRQNAFHGPPKEFGTVVARYADTYERLLAHVHFSGLRCFIAKESLASAKIEAKIALLI